MAPGFRNVQQLAGTRVRMQFSDGREVVATLLTATTDLDGRRHLLYDAVEDDTGAVASGNVTCIYADAATLLSIEPAGEALAGATRG